MIIGEFTKIHNSQWAALTFIIPKINGTVRFISEFRELNKIIKTKPLGFRYATSLDLTLITLLYVLYLGLCTIVLLWGKFEYEILPLGLCNSPDIFPEKINKFLDGLEYVRAYIENLLIISNGSFEDHLNKVKIVLQKLIVAGFKINAEKSFSPEIIKSILDLKYLDKA